MSERSLASAVARLAASATALNAQVEEKTLAEVDTAIAEYLAARTSDRLHAGGAPLLNRVAGRGQPLPVKDVVRFVATGPNADHDALFKSLVERPLFPADASLAAIRDIMDSLGGLNPPVPEDAKIAHVKGATWTGKMLTPINADPRRVVLYARGGAYTMSRVPAAWEYPVYRIAKAGNASALILNYRLAPEDPFPAARDDLVASYTHLLAQGHAAKNIVLAGDSAGGGLVLQALTHLRDSGTDLPAGAVIVGAWIDLANESPSRQSNADDPFATPDFLAMNAAAYLGGRSPRAPEVNPLYADLQRLPPVRLLVGSRESLRDDSTRFAEVAARAGVDVQVEVWRNLNHGWYIFSQLAESEAAHSRLGYLIRLLTPL